MEIHNPSVDIEFMPIEELKKNVLSYYNIEINEIESVKFKDTDKQRAVYKVFTDRGCKCLKKVYYDKPSLLFIYSVIEWLNAKRILCPRLISTKRGLKYVEYNGNLFILMDWIDGRKCNYDDINDIVKAAENLGRIHKDSRGFMPIEGSSVKESDNDYYDSYNKHFIQLLELSNKAYSIGDKYSKAFIDQFDYYMEASKESVYLLSQIDFSVPLGDDVSSKSICHLDYVNKNLIFTPNDKIYIIDFDKCSIDMPIHDITSFLRRILKRKDTAWNFNIFRSAIESYERVRPLSYYEHLAILAILMFPHKYWKISRDYFKNRQQCNKDAFLAIIKKIGQQQKQHYVFCNSVREYIEYKF